MTYSNNPVIAYFDGLVEPRNPGGYGCGGYVIEPHAGVEGPYTGRAFFGEEPTMTNNQAEYKAALLVLAELWRKGYRGAVVLRGDSQLVCRHYSGQYQCNSPLLVPLLARLHRAGQAFESLILEWVPRESNEDADAQSRAAYRDRTGREPPTRRKGA